MKRNEIGAISERYRSDIGVLGGDSGRPQHGAAGPERPELCSEAQTAPARARARAPRAAGDKSLLCYLPGRRPKPIPSPSPSLALALALALALLVLALALALALLALALPLPSPGRGSALR